MKLLSRTTLDFSSLSKIHVKIFKDEGIEISRDQGDIG